MNSFESVESSLKAHLPEAEYDQVRRILYGKECAEISAPLAEKIAAENDFELKAYSMVSNVEEEQNQNKSRTKAEQNQNKSRTKAE